MKVTRAAKRRIYSSARQVHVVAAGAVLFHERIRRDAADMHARLMDDLFFHGAEYVDASLLQPLRFAEAIRDDIQRLNREVLSEVIAEVMRASATPARPPSAL